MPYDVPQCPAVSRNALPPFLSSEALHVATWPSAAGPRPYLVPRHPGTLAVSWYTPRLTSTALLHIRSSPMSLPDVPLCLPLLPCFHSALSRFIYSPPPSSTSPCVPVPTPQGGPYPSIPLPLFFPLPLPLSTSASRFPLPAPIPDLCYLSHTSASRDTVPYTYLLFSVSAPLCPWSCILGRTLQVDPYPFLFGSPARCVMFSLVIT